MPMSDHEYINFSQDDELNYILKKYKKKQSQENRSELKKLGDECKKELKARVLKHTEFYPFLDKHVNKLS